jgi:hypothetical protein
VRAAPAFDRICEQLEATTPLNRLEARGTIRLILRDAGLGAKTLNARQAVTMIEKLLPEMQNARGIDEADGVCTAIKRALATLPSADERDDLASVFRRIR